jgi:hypothetical protein
MRLPVSRVVKLMLLLAHDAEHRTRARHDQSLGCFTGPSGLAISDHHRREAATGERPAASDHVPYAVQYPSRSRMVPARGVSVADAAAGIERIVNSAQQPLAEDPFGCAETRNQAPVRAPASRSSLPPAPSGPIDRLRLSLPK